MACFDVLCNFSIDRYSVSLYALTKAVLRSFQNARCHYRRTAWTVVTSKPVPQLVASKVIRVVGKMTNRTRYNGLNRKAVRAHLSVPEALHKTLPTLQMVSCSNIVYNSLRNTIFVWLLFFIAPLCIFGC